MESNIGDATASGRDRRRYSRVKCRMPAELRRSGISYPIQGETTDVSLGGCYVASMFPLPANTEVEFRCWAGDVSIRCKAVVCTSDPGVGNGIRFVDLDADAASALGAHLAKVDGAEPEVTGLSGVITH